MSAHSKNIQWGIRYGDGEIDGPFSSEQDAVERMRSHRDFIARHLSDDDFEDVWNPMTVMQRTHRVNISKWREATT